MRPAYGERHMVYRNPHQSVYRVPTRTEAGARDLYVTDYGVRAALVVEGSDGILLTRQYRYLIDALSLEIPGGRANEGELLVDAAVRECLEETGVRALSATPLIVFHPGLDTLHNPTHVFYTTEFEIAGTGPQHSEEVQNVLQVPLTSYLAMIADGKIVDSLSLIALLSFARHQEDRSPCLT